MGNASQPTRTTQSNEQQSTAPSHQVIEANFTVKYDEVSMILSVGGIQILRLPLKHYEGETISMGGRQKIDVSVNGNGTRIEVRGRPTVVVQTTRNGMNIDVGAGRVVHVQYDRNGMTAALFQNGVLVHSSTTENAAAGGGGVPLLGFSDADLDRASTTFNYSQENVEEEEAPVAVGGAPLHGFSDADIDRVSTTFKYVEPPEKSSSGKDEDPCSICLEPFKADECMRKLRCGHEFHSSCVVPWLRRQTTCPNCRKKISLKRKGI